MKKKITDLIIDSLIFSGLPLVRAANLESTKTYFGNDIPNFVTKHEIIFIIAIVSIFIIRQTFSLIEFPEKNDKVDEFTNIIGAIFTDIVKEYSTKVAEISNGASPTFRVNIMLKKRKYFFFTGMKIYYFGSSIEKIHYSEDELDYLWSKSEGTCGSAWDNSRICIYDKKDNTFRRPVKSLKSRVRPFVSKIGSVISIPIWSKTDNKCVFGILSLDSSFTIDRTLFDRDDIVDILAKHVVRLSLILEKFRNGVW
ncbi:hypothetical protein CH352_18785 [Leptospira hartskeerlii]|uniref:Uncharacterized protein n=1 Tax=Leptospira hartskeerlii TaxID=2023177 RepID=A0A2M9X897_9LEPT|nr:hypothetical protein [Leptospira hartskeerlii]PJZ23923.1 hypothetical protein CH357_18695 [Leptospira hartskeerlii]PJZ31931.1 hypothetical protein CH352_18785 [Leptospira hartskeerlii]